MSAAGERGGQPLVRAERLLELQNQLDQLEPTGPQPPGWLATTLHYVNAAASLILIVMGFALFAMTRQAGGMLVLFGGVLGFMWMYRAARDDWTAQRKARIEAEIDALLGDDRA